MRLFCAALRTPAEVSGAAWLDGTAYLRIEGSGTQVSRRGQLLAPFGEAEVLTDATHADLWQGIRDARHFAGRGDLWRIGVRPTDAPQVCQALRDRLGVRVSLDWGGSLIWANGPVLPPRTVREIAAVAGGCTTRVRRTPGVADAVAPEAVPRLAAIARALRQQFDPAQILNPGLAAD